MTTPPAWGGRPAARLRAWARTHLPPVCSICGQPIDMGLPYNHPGAFTVDHVIPLAAGGDPYNVDNVDVAHKQCNRRKGTHIGPIPPTTQRTKPLGYTPTRCTCHAWPEPNDPNCPAHYCRFHEGQCGGGPHSRNW